MSHISNLLVRIREDKVYFGSLVVTFGLFTASAINYFLHFVLGRLMSVPNYGTFNALLSLSYILVVPSNVLMLAIIKVVASLKVEDRYDVLTNLFWNLFRLLALTSSIIVIVLTISRSQIADYLNVYPSILIAFFGVFIGFSYMFALPSGYLQGLLRFKGFAAFSISAAAIRFLFGVGFVVMGLGVMGLFTGVSLALALAFLIGLLLLRKNFSDYEQQDVRHYYKKILKLGVPLLLVQISMNVLSNADLILVKHFFDETSAGLYASVVTIGKILLFGAGIISSVMYPIVSEAYSKNEDCFIIFKKFFALQLLIALVGIGMFFLAPELISAKMFGEKFIPAAVYLPKFSIFVGLYVFINFLIMFFLAIERARVSIILLVGVILQVIMINLFHATIDVVIMVNTTISALLLMSLLLFLARLRKSLGML